MSKMERIYRPRPRCRAPTPTEASLQRAARRKCLRFPQKSAEQSYSELYRKRRVSIRTDETGIAARLDALYVNFLSGWELDLTTMRWVEDGFVRPEAKGEMAWVDVDHVFVATDFGEGSMTASGYPRTVRLWNRGTPMADARLVFERCGRNKRRACRATSPGCNWCARPRTRRWPRTA